MALTASAGPFQLPFPEFWSRWGAAGRAARGVLEHALRLPRLNAIYAHIHASPRAENFCEDVLSALRVCVQIDDADLARVPRSGPLMVVSNHPFGGLDGIVLAALLQRVRPDVRLMVNFLLGCLPEFREISFLVNPFGGPAAVRQNVAALREAVRWVRGGAALGVFPAGAVAHLTLRNGVVTDPPWAESVARLVQRAGATVVPVFFEGRNTSFFQVAGLLHPRLRTLLLPHELLQKRGATIHVRVGSPIEPRRQQAFSDPAALRDYLRLRCYLLREQGQTRTRRTQPQAAPQPIAAPTPAELVAAEVAALPAACTLAESGEFAVLLADAGQIPQTLREIGRLREVTFRAAGEGSGKALDLDRFDDYYRHLFVWNRARRHVVGAYRLGMTDEIVATRGPGGLYTRTLFRFSPRLLGQISPAIELGRSFVVAEYQRSHSPLTLLWRGIGKIVAAKPRYRRLFGVVSISDEYHTLTKQLLVAFLRATKLDSELARCVRAKHPPRVARFRDAGERPLAAVVRDLDDVAELVAEIERDRRGVPVLLRQYLRLNARILGFNVDAQFGGVLDGLILVDLLQVERPVLDRYLGRAEAARFLEHHEAGCGAAAAG